MSGIEVSHWVPEPHINPIMGIGALHWALEPVLGILAPYQPCIHLQVPEPLSGDTDQASLPLARYHWPHNGHCHPFQASCCPGSPPPHAQPGFLLDPVELTPVEQKCPPAP